MRFVLIPTLVSLAMGSVVQGGPPGGGGGGGGGFQRSQQGRTPPATETSGAQAPNSIPTINSVTKHTINLPSGPLSYTAKAAQVSLTNDNGDVECKMYYVAYTKDGANIGKRPVTFAFNGGPGSATLWLHMGALGPKRAPMPDDGSLPKPPYTAVDNMESWLDFTDVVVIDAPGTGYSRIANQGLASRYFGVRQDINAFTEFVRKWLTENERWSSPSFIAGESYGGIRGSGLSNSLFRAGIAVNGFISISGTSNFMTLDGMRGNDTTFLGFFPSMAACAWYHKKLGPRFKSVEQTVKEATEFTNGEYANALLRGDSLTDQEKEHIAARMSEFLGVSKDYCLGSNLKVSEFAFFRELLRDQGKQIGRYDGRLTGAVETKTGQGGGGDPSDEATTPPFTTSINDYMERDLEIKTSLRYLNSGSVNPWQEPEGSYAETASDLRNVISRNPHFKVLYCCGYYDLACPFNATMFTVNHMGLDKAARSRISYTFYPAGHMMYIEKSSRIKFHDDVKKFVADCLGG